MAHLLFKTNEQSSQTVSLLAMPFNWDAIYQAHEEIGMALQHLYCEYDNMNIWAILSVLLYKYYTSCQTV